jgi:glyoxylase-like metal-dependent hydrolase (beta-lactamase superfamily II)
LASTEVDIGRSAVYGLGNIVHAMAQRRELGRGERVIPGLWRLRLPLPFPGIPHCNAWAIAAGSGLVLVDTGIYEPGSMTQLERAFEQVGLAVEDVSLLAITHAHIDHWGQAAPIRDRAGCELWMHPNHRHATEPAEDPERALARRLEVGRQAGVSEEALRAYAERAKEVPSGIARVIEPDRDLVPGVEIETDLGVWHVYETPGHAPSHVCLHQPDRRLLISGDHVLGRISLFYEYGWTPDPVGEFLHSLDVVDRLDARLCLSGHGKPFLDAHGHIDASRRLANQRLEAVRRGLSNGARTGLEVVPEVFIDESHPRSAPWRLTETLCYLRHLEVQGEVVRESDGEVERWELARAARQP